LTRSADIGSSGGLDQGAEGTAQVGGVDRRADLGGEDDRGVGPRLACLEFFGGLACAV
jgi:hypothetical protein